MTRTRFGGGVIGGTGAAFRRHGGGVAEFEVSVDRWPGSVLLLAKHVLYAAGGDSCGGDEVGQISEEDDVSQRKSSCNS